jgi:hypothetical protein
MNRERRQFWLGAGAALMAGLLLRLWFVRHLPVVQGDSLIYGAIARDWLQHGVYGFSETVRAPGLVDVRPTLIRLPGYPLFLAACFRVFGMENYRAAMLVQVAVDLATCCMAAGLAARLFGGRAGIAVLWLAALCPFTANYVAAPLTETLVLNSIALAFFAFAKWLDAGVGFNRWLWVVAAAMAWSVLLRPEQGLLAAAILPAMLWRSLATRAANRRSFLPVFAAALCVVLPLVPWTARNWRTFHVFQPLAPRYATDPGELAPLGFNRWYRTWAIDFSSTYEVYWNYNGDVIAVASLPLRAFDVGPADATQAMRDRTAALLDGYNLTTTMTPAIDARFAALGEERARAHPILACCALPVARLLDMLLRPRTEMLPAALEWWRWSQHRAQTAFAVAYAALNFGYIAAGLCGLYVWRRRGWAAIDATGFRELAFAMAASLILRSALLLTLDNSEPRYTLEFFPVLLAWAGALFATSPGRAEMRSAVE